MKTEDEINGVVYAHRQWENKLRREMRAEMKANHGKPVTSDFQRMEQKLEESSIQRNVLEWVLGIRSELPINPGGTW